MDRLAQLPERLRAETLPLSEFQLIRQRARFHRRARICFATTPLLSKIHQFPGVRPASHVSRGRRWSRTVWSALARGRVPDLAWPGGVERCFDVTRAHASGFAAELPLRDALASTAREELAWMRILHRQEA